MKDLNSQASAVLNNSEGKRGWFIVAAEEKVKAVDAELNMG
jgi:hypothetical protein